MNNRPPKIATWEDVNTYFNRMRKWAATIDKQIGRVADMASLHAEADEVKATYADIPAQIRELEQAKATLQASVVELKESYELVEANLSLTCNGKNAEQRKAQLKMALAENDEAAALSKEIADKELNVKLLDVEIEEKERLWSDYHRRVQILMAKAGIAQY